MTTQGLEALAEKSAKAKEKVAELAKKFHALEVEMKLMLVLGFFWRRDWIKA